MGEALRDRGSLSGRGADSNRWPCRSLASCRMCSIGTEAVNMWELPPRVAFWDRGRKAQGEGVPLDERNQSIGGECV